MRVVLRLIVAPLAFGLALGWILGGIIGGPIGTTLVLVLAVGGLAWAIHELFWARRMQREIKTLVTVSELDRVYHGDDDEAH